MFVIRQEYPCVPLVRSGIKKVLKVSHALGICAYWSSLEWMFEQRDGLLFARDPAKEWLGSWAPEIENPDGLTFAEPVGVQLVHRLTAPSMQGPLIRPVRDPRNAAISNYERLRTRKSDRPISITDYLDMPLPPGQGGMFGLGHLEEWLLQEQLIALTRGQAPLLDLSHEKLQQVDAGIEEVKSYCEFIGVRRTEEQIQQAVRGADVKNFKSTSKRPAAVDRWRDGDYPDLVSRYDLLASVIPDRHGYEFQPVSLPPLSHWQVEPFEFALKAWITRTGSRVLGGLPQTDISPLLPLMVELAQRAEQLPLLEYSLLAELIDEQRDLDFAVGRLGALAELGSSFVTLACELKLSELGKANSLRLTDYTNQLKQPSNVHSHVNQALEMIGLAKIEYVN